MSERISQQALDLEAEMISILSIVNSALAAVGAGDPLRQDLEEIRLAAQLAAAKMQLLASRSAP